MTSMVAITPVDHAGGAEIGLLRLLRRLRAAGWALTLTTPGDGPLARAARERGIHVERLAVGGLAGGAGARAVASWPGVRRLARAHDVVYLNGTVCGRLLPAAIGARTVLHVHDLVERVSPLWHRADVLLADSRAAAERLGRLVSPGDPAALAAAVAEVLDRRAEMGAAARERARRWHAGEYASRWVQHVVPGAPLPPEEMA